MFQQLLRTSRYHMPPRITRNSHRPSATGAGVANRTMVGSFQTDHGNDYSNRAQTKAIQKRSIRGVVLSVERLRVC